MKVSNQISAAMAGDWTLHDFSGQLVSVSQRMMMIKPSTA